MATNDKETTVKETLTKETIHEKSEALDKRIKRIDQAHACFKNYATGAVAVGFVPAPLIDMAALSAIQLKMVHSISAIYDVPFSKNMVKSIIGSIVGSSVAVTLAMPIASMMKVIPIIGQSSGMLSTAVIGAASTYAIGKLFAEHFESGGTFLDFDEEKARAHFKELYEEGKAFVSSQKTTTA
jgi:uncharacterized protein (DUF697 family)